MSERAVNLRELRRGGSSILMWTWRDNCCMGRIGWLVDWTFLVPRIVDRKLLIPLLVVVVVGIGSWTVFVFEGFTVCTGEVGT